MIPDSELLNRFAQARDEVAFAELVRRHLNHVYSTGLRLLGGDRQMAEDVAQIVFTSLAKKAGALRNYCALSSWLHTSARFAAANLVRSEQRRRVREQEVLSMPQTYSDSDPDWEKIRAVLDEAIGALNEPDREALLLRYFETKSFAEIGGFLRITENAARMRIERAVDKLRSRLALRGITSTATALSAALAQVAVVEAPASLGSQITSRAVEAVAGRSSLVASRIFSTSARVGVVGLVLIGLVVTVILKRPDQHASSPTEVSSAAKAEVVLSGGDTPRQIRGDSGTPARQGLELVFIDDATGAQVTNRLITLTSWNQQAGRMIEHELELRDGRCEVPFEPEPWGDQRILRCLLDGFADARLRWSVNEADPPSIADSLIVHLVRPTPIGGRVVDISGEPVAGALVGISTDNFPPSASFSEDHCLDYTTVETDAKGRWRLNRVAPEMAGRISVEARHPDYADSERGHDHARAGAA